MDKIKIDPLFQEQVKKLNDKIQKVYESDASHFVKGNFRAEVFNIKSFLTKSRNKDQILYIPINTVGMAWGGFADFCVGDGIEVEIDDETAQEKWNEIAESNSFDEILYNAIIEQSVYGYGNIRTRLQDARVIIEQIPYKYYYPELSNIYFGEDPKTIHIISESMQAENTIMKRESKAKIQTYTMIWDKREIVEKLCKKEIDGRKVISIESQETIDFLNIYRIDNKKLWDRYLWVSDFLDVLDLAEEVNDKVTQMSVEFIKHLRSKMSLPEGINKLIEAGGKDSDGKPKLWVQDLDVFVHRQGENPAQYIENKNFLIAEARQHIILIVRLMSALVQCPSSFFGIDEQGSEEKVEALKIKMMRFLKKVQRKQNAIKNTVKKIVKWSLLLAGINTDLSVEVKFSDDILIDKQQMFENYVVLNEKGLLSKKSTMWYVLDREVENVEKELLLLQEEKTALDVTKKTDGNNWAWSSGRDQGADGQGTV